MGKKIIRVIAVVLIPVVCLYLLTLLLTPKYVNDIPEGSMIAEYYKSEKNNDVLILGDCEVYENISTVKMWEEYGITSPFNLYQDRLFVASDEIRVIVRYVLSGNQHLPSYEKVGVMEIVLVQHSVPA